MVLTRWAPPIGALLLKMNDAQKRGAFPFGKAPILIPDPTRWLLAVGEGCASGDLQVLGLLGLGHRQSDGQYAILIVGLDLV